MKVLCILSFIIALIALFFSIFSNIKMKETLKVKELSAEKISIVEPDGTKRLLIFNSKHMPGPVIENKEFSAEIRGGGGAGAGILFLNSEGTEMGGVLWEGGKEDGKYVQQFYFSVDPYLQNEVFNIGISDNNGERSFFMSLYDRPKDFEGFKRLISLYDEYLKVKDTDSIRAKEIEIKINEYIKKYAEKNEWEIPRLTLTKGAEGYIGVALYDKKGSKRMELFIDDEGNPTFTMFDRDGKPKKIIP